MSRSRHRTSSRFTWSGAALLVCAARKWRRPRKVSLVVRPLEPDVDPLTVSRMRLSNPERSVAGADSSAVVDFLPRDIAAGLQTANAGSCLRRRTGRREGLRRRQQLARSHRGQSRFSRITSMNFDHWAGARKNPPRFHARSGSRALIASGQGYRVLVRLQSKQTLTTVCSGRAGNRKLHPINRDHTFDPVTIIPAY